MDDTWEIVHGLNVGVDDSGLDLDSDGRTNLEELQEGTLPNDSRSFLHLSVTTSVTGLNLEFTALPNIAYTIQYTDSLEAPINWIDLEEIDAEPGEREFLLEIKATESQRFFRVIPSPP
jgi:hypothetical protein